MRNELCEKKEKVAPLSNNEKPFFVVRLTDAKHGINDLVGFSAHGESKLVTVARGRCGGIVFPPLHPGKHVVSCDGL